MAWTRARGSILTKPPFQDLKGRAGESQNHAILKPGP